MRRHPVFLVYGLALLMGAAAAQFSGWTLFRPSEVRGVPKSVRENPGVYRSIYSGYRRYSGGK